MRAGDPVFLEIDADVCKYRGRFIRTARIGHADDKELRLADELLRVQEQAIATVAPGVIPSRWSCEQARAPELPEGLPPAPPTYQCELIVPAKRLNYLADGVDVVFFDDIEPSNPAFAMWVAIQGLKAFPATAEAGRTAEANLCTTAIPRGERII